jgi:hypothetical protein
VRQEYRRMVGPEAEDFFHEFGDAIEIADEDLNRLTVTDVDEPGQPKHTFREVLDDIRAAWDGRPCFVASTEF